MSGADRLDDRPGFAKLVDHCMATGIRIIIFEDANRTARDLLVQLMGHDALTVKGFKLVSAASPEQFVDDSPPGTLMRHIIAAVSQFEKSNLVAKLAGARKRAAERKAIKTWKGTMQASGPQNKLDGPDGAAIRKTLRPYIAKRKLDKGDATTIATSSAANLVTKENGERFSHGTIARWHRKAVQQVAEQQ